MSHPLLNAPLGTSLLRLAAPTTLLMVVQVLVAIADVYIASRLGTAALAATALLIPFTTLMVNLAHGAFGGAVAASMARALGSGSAQAATVVFSQALLLATFLGALFALAGFFVLPRLYVFLGGEGASLDLAIAYSYIFFGGSVLLWLNAFLAALLRGSGDAKTPSLYGIATSVAYFPLAALLSLGAGDWRGMGLVGLAVSSLLVSALGAMALLHAIYRGRLGVTPAIDARPHPATLYEMVQVGVFGSLSTFSSNVSAVIVTGLVGQFGVSALAGYGIGARLEFVSAPLAFGIGSALTTMVGLAAGAGDWERARKAARLGAFAAFLLLGAIGWSVALFPYAWAELFTTDAAVLQACASYVRHVAPTFCFLGLGLALHFASQGARRMRIPVAASIARLIVTALLGWLAVRHTALGLDGVYWAIAFGLVVYGSVLGLAQVIAPWKSEPA